MPRKSTTMALCLTEETRSILSTLARSRTAPAHHVERSAIILQLVERREASEIATTLGINRQRVTRCARRVATVGPLKAIDDLPRSGRPPDITEAARTWLIGEACVKAKERGSSSASTTTIEDPTVPALSNARCNASARRTAPRRCLWCSFATANPITFGLPPNRPDQRHSADGTPSSASPLVPRARATNAAPCSRNTSSRPRAAPQDQSNLPGVAVRRASAPRRPRVRGRPGGRARACQGSATAARPR
jgi:hypothetical protein